MVEDEVDAGGVPIIALRTCQTPITDPVLSCIWCVLNLSLV